jgi:hypothetical protein
METGSFQSHVRNIRDWLPRMPEWLSPHRAKPPVIPDDLEVERSGVSFVDGRDELDYLWYRLREREGGREYAGYRVVRLLQLSFLPLEGVQILACCKKCAPC